MPLVPLRSLQGQLIIPVFLSGRMRSSARGCNRCRTSSYARREALERITEGQAMIRSNGEAGTGDCAQMQQRRCTRSVGAARLTLLSTDELYVAAKGFAGARHTEFIGAYRVRVSLRHSIIRGSSAWRRRASVKDLGSHRCRPAVVWAKSTS